MNTLTENRKAVWFYSLHKYEWANYSFKVLSSAQFFFLKWLFKKKKVSIWDELLLSNKHLTHVLFLLCSQKTFQPNSSSHWVRHCNKLSTPVRTFPTSIVDRAARWNCVNLSLSFGMKTLQSFFSNAYGGTCTDGYLMLAISFHLSVSIPYAWHVQAHSHAHTCGRTAEVVVL